MKFKAERVVANAHEKSAFEWAELSGHVREAERAAFDFALTGRRMLAKADKLTASANEKTNLARSHRLNSAEKMRHKARVWLGYEADCVAWARRARREIGA